MTQVEREIGKLLACQAELRTELQGLQAALQLEQRAPRPATWDTACFAWDKDVDALLVDVFGIKQGFR
jgi:hypothetical protein